VSNSPRRRRGSRRQLDAVAGYSAVAKGSGIVLTKLAGAHRRGSARAAGRFRQQRCVDATGSVVVLGETAGANGQAWSVTLNTVVYPTTWSTNLATTAQALANQLNALPDFEPRFRWTRPHRSRCSSPGLPPERFNLTASAPANGTASAVVATSAATVVP